MSSAAVVIGTLRVKLFCTVQPYATGLIMLSLTLAVIDSLQVKDLIFTSFLVQHAGSANCSIWERIISIQSPDCSVTCIVPHQYNT